jgi:hypothetical protein
MRLLSRSKLRQKMFGTLHSRATPPPPEQIFFGLVSLFLISISEDMDFDEQVKLEMLAIQQAVKDAKQNVPPELLITGISTPYLPPNCRDTRHPEPTCLWTVVQFSLLSSPALGFCSDTCH